MATRRSGRWGSRRGTRGSERWKGGWRWLRGGGGGEGGSAWRVDERVDLRLAVRGDVAFDAKKEGGSGFLMVVRQE
uniref:Uncharacterized protein n=1 Tax=Hyaloperonospora arabidopsidis (strain Emoy2) TaxID=559515 RepID=M4B739_HYAAE